MDKSEDVENAYRRVIDIGFWCDEFTRNMSFSGEPKTRLQTGLMDLAIEHQV